MIALNVRADRGFQPGYQGEVHAKDEPDPHSYINNILINNIISAGRKAAAWRVAPSP